MNQADAFIIDQAGVGSHLWTIISDPTQDPDRVLMTNLTTWTPDGDPSCIVQPGDHPFVRHKSYVYYASSRCVPHEYLVKGCSRNWIKAHEPLSEELFQRVLDGAQETIHLPIEYRDLLVSQGIISN